MRKVYLIIFCMLITLMLSGCGEKKDEIKYDTIENIYKSASTAVKYETKNLSFSGTPRVPNVSEVKTLKLKRKDYVAQMEPMVRFFSDTYDPSLITKVANQIPQDNNYETDNFMFSAAEGGFVYWPYNNGSVDQRLYDVLNCQSERVSIVKPYRGEPLSEEALPMTDGNLSMKQAGEQVQAFLNEKMKQIEPEYDYRIRTVITRKYDAQSYAYSFFIERVYKNINLDASVSYINDEIKVKYHNGNVSRVGLPLQINIFSVNGYKTWNIVSRAFNYTVSAEQPLENKFVTFESAFKALSKVVSSKTQIVIDSAELCYDISYPGFVTLAKIDENDNPPERFFNQVKEYTSTPMWMFIVDRENEDGNKLLNDMHSTFMVNALTGEVSIYNERCEF